MEYLQFLTDLKELCILGEKLRLINLDNANICCTFAIHKFDL